MSDTMQEVFARLGSLEISLAELKASVAGFVDSMATRMWVQQEIAPIHDDLKELSRAVAQVADRQGELYASHESFLQAEAKRKEEMHAAELEALRQQSLGAWCKKFVVIAAGLITVAAGGGVVAVFLKWVILYVLSH